MNGKKIKKEVPDHMLLSTLLRDHLNLTGTHVGCDTSQCGACVVDIDGKSIKSCTAFAADLEGSKITAIPPVERTLFISDNPFCKLSKFLTPNPAVGSSRGLRPSEAMTTSKI